MMTACSDKGVYAIAMSAKPDAAWSLPCTEFTPSLEARRGLTVRWLSDQPVFYIGKTDRTARHRLGQFYTHRFGQRSPHAGGQHIVVLPMIENANVFWAEAVAPIRERNEGRSRRDTSFIFFVVRALGSWAAMEAPCLTTATVVLIAAFSKGLGNAEAARLISCRAEQPYVSVDDLWRRAAIPSAALVELAEADAFRPSLSRARREALWAIKALRDEPLPLFTAAASRETSPIAEQFEPVVSLKL